MKAVTDAGVHKMHDSSAEPSAPGGSVGELEARRLRVVELRLLRKYSQQQIATVLGVDQATISRDIAWIAQHRKELFGSPAKLEVESEIGEAYDFYCDVEAKALRGFHKAEDAKGQNTYLRTAILARGQRINLLQDLGFIDRQLGQIGLTLRADAVRAALREEGLLISERALSTADEDDDEVDKWLKKESA